MVKEIPEMRCENITLLQNYDISEAKIPVSTKT
jgi:hypothetical protein